VKRFYIKSTKNADSRSVENFDSLTPESLYKQTLNHKKAVELIINDFAQTLIQKSKEHDHTKLSYDGKSIDPEFFNAIKSGKTGSEFYELDWWKRHASEESHHDLANHEDVNLIDIVEMVSDCIAAGLARTGEIYPINIDQETINRAINNTVRLYKVIIGVIDDKKE